MAVRDDDYKSGTNFADPAVAQRKGNYSTMIKGYNKATVDYFGHNESIIVGMPNIGKGSGSGFIFPKAWVGAESIHNLSVIDTGTTPAKIGTGVGTVRNATIQARNDVNVFDETAYPPYVFAGGSTSNPGYNYMTQKGQVGSGTAVLAKCGNTVLVDALGEDVTIEGSESSCVIASNWERSIRFIPATITPAAEVFIAGKGYGDATTCQWAISYDSTNIYRTIGGSKVAVGATATYLSTTKETRLSIVNLTTKDSFYINATKVRDNQTGNRGTTTSTLKEMFGGIYETNSPSAASYKNALGNYRQFCRYGSLRLINPNIIDQQQESAFLNYTTSILVMGHGDSIMNGAGGSANDRSLCWFFLNEAWAKSLGYDVLYLNGGVNGTAFDSFRPSRLPQPAFRSDTLSYNINYMNVSRSTRNWLVDMVIGNSGTNEYANQFSANIPYNWAAQYANMKLISMECASCNIPFIYNTSGGHTLPNEQYEADVLEDVARSILSRSESVFDWHTDLVNPTTQIGYSWAFNDDVHLSLDGNKWVNEKLKPHVLPYLVGTRYAFPETAV